MAEKERSKLTELLTQTQDKAFRRISELKEQNEMMKQSKVDLESSFQTNLVEKDSEISKLQSQVDNVVVLQHWLYSLNS